jgi:RHS repeat-associated protein
VYEQNSFEPVARVVQLAEHIEQKRLADIAYETRRFVRIGESEETISQRIADNSKPLINIYHYHCNHLGTPQELTNQDGDVIWLSYDRAWGGSFDTLYKQQFVDNFAISENELQPIKFQGQSLDTETGLHYNRFRYYDSDVGMFISRDPIGLLGGVNVFAYAPNPIHWIDPWGLSPCHYKEVEKQQLPKQVAESFTDGKYKTVELQQDMTYYRVYGGNAQANGGFVTTNPAVNRIQSKIDSALLPEWGNTRQFEATIVVPKGTIVNIGTVAPQTTKSGTVLSGGADQILLPRGYDSSWIKGSRNVPP